MIRGYRIWLDRISTSYGTQPTGIASKTLQVSVQLALVWLFARGDDIVPIPGTKRQKYLQQNVRAMDIGLIAEDINRIDRIAPLTVGNRYPEEAMRGLNL